MASSQPLNTGAFVPSTFTLDISQIYATDVKSPEFKELIVKLYQYLSDIAKVTNVKVSGQYPLQEYLNSKLWFPNPTLNSSSTTTPVQRQVFHTLINFGALPGGAIPNPKTVAHGINPNTAFRFVDIWGAATDPLAIGVPGAQLGIPLPYVSANAVADNLEVYVTDTDVVVTSGGTNYSNFTTSYIVIEYIKS